MTRRTEQEFMQDLTLLLTTEGVSNLTIAEMANRLKCSKRRLYQIAPTKEEIFLYVCKAVLTKNLERGALITRAGLDPRKEISEYLQATLNASGIKKPCLVDLDTTEAGRKLFDDYQEARIRGLESIIERGVKEKIFTQHNPRLVSEAILGAARRLRNQDFLDEAGLNVGEAFQQFYQIILNGLLEPNQQ